MGGLYTHKNRSIPPVAVYGLSHGFLFLLLLLEITYAIVGKCSTYGLVRNRFFRESFIPYLECGELDMPDTVNPIVDIQFPGFKVLKDGTL